MIVLLVGPQGSGKGTQGERLAEYLGLPVFSMGQLLRDEMAAGTEIGNKVRDIMNSGNLVSDEDTTEVLSHRLKQEDAKNGAIIDGYPRTAEQFAAMKEIFSPDVVVALELNDDEAVKRLSGRWMCPEGHIFNVNTNPPKEAGKCDHEGSVLYQREDDTEEAIRQRLFRYHRDSEPIIAELESLDGVRVLRVDASQSIEAVWNDIKASFSNLN